MNINICRLLIGASLLGCSVPMVYAFSPQTEQVGNSAQVRVITQISAHVEPSLSSNAQPITTLQIDELASQTSAGLRLSTPLSLESNTDEPYVVSAESVDGKNQSTDAVLDYGNGATSDYTVSYTGCSGGAAVPLSTTGQVINNSQLNAADCQQKSGELHIDVAPSSTEIASGATAEGNVAVIVQQQ